jgi:magnesium transporter
MNNLQGTFFFLSQIIKIPVIDFATGKRIGTTVDILAEFKEMYPKVSGLIVYQAKLRKKFYVPWKNVKKVIEDKAICIEVTPDLFQPDNKVPEEEILLKEILLDKQIVDVNGSKVVRVNDLHLLREDFKLWVVHVDVGITGLLRRLGCLRFFNFVVKLISSVELEDRFISWKFVQPITPAIGYEALSLKVHHSRLAELHPAELADIIIDLGLEERIDILKSLDNVTAARTFQELPLKIRLQIAGLLPHEQLVNIIKEMAIDEVVDLLRELPQRKRNAVLNHLPQDKDGQVSRLLSLSERIAGSLMNTEFIAVKHNLSAAAVLDKIKNESHKKESIYYIYVLDDNDALTGMVTLRQLLTASPEKIISEFMHKRVVKVRVETHIKDVVEVFYKYDFTVIPVVDKQNKIQGIITMKDAFEAVFRQIREEGQEAT